MGEEDRDITQLTLDFEGTSLRVSTTRRAASKAPAPSPKVRPDSSCAGAYPEPVSASASGPSPSSASLHLLQPLALDPCPARLDLARP